MVHVKGVADPINAFLNLENKINDNLKPVPSYTLEIQKDSALEGNIKISRIDIEHKT